MQVADVRWLRFRRKELTKREIKRLVAAYQNGKKDITFVYLNETTYYVFLDRVAREYNFQWEKKPDRMHLNRENLIKSAIATVYSQLTPADHLPHGGDKDSALHTIQPLLETTFRMPGQMLLTPGSSMWVKKKLACNDWTYADCVKYPEMLSAVVTHLIRTGKSEGKQCGYPEMKATDSVPFAKLYEVNPARVASRRSTERDRHFPFLRAISVKKAITLLRNMNKLPVRVPAANGPHGVDWNNFAEVLHIFCIFYLFFEGVLRSQDLATSVRLSCDIAFTNPLH